MAEILPGYTYDQRAGRYRNQRTGKFVARRHIVEQLDAQIRAGEQRLRDMTEAFHEGRLSPSVWAEQMRSEVRRLHLQNAAMGKGGFAQLDQRDYGRVGGKLRAEYRNVENFARQVQAGEVTLPQALTRADGYVGGARVEFFEAERRAQQQAEQRRNDGMTTINRRHLDPAAKHCRDCPGYYDQGWQREGILPVPGTRCQCRSHCRCRMSRRSVPVGDLADWIGTKR